MLKDEGMGKDKPKFTLLMDEIKIKQCLVFSKCTGELVEFTNLSTVNEDLASLTQEVPADEPDSPIANHQLAKQMLVFMIIGLFLSLRFHPLLLRILLQSSW